MRQLGLTVALAFVLHLGCTETKPETAAGGPSAAEKAAPAAEKAPAVDKAPAAEKAPAVDKAPAAEKAPAPATPAGKVVATYALDREAMSKLVDAEVAKLPPMDRAAAKIGAEVMKLTDVKLTLHEGSQGEMATTKPTAERGGVGKVTTEALTWEQKGKELVLTGPKELKRPMKCTRAGAVMTCVQAGGPVTMIFKRR